MKLFSELQRRNVYRVASAYIVVGWLVMQVIDVMAPALQLPDWVASLLAMLLLIGFPIAMVLTWIYDVTPEGVVRTDPADAEAVARTASRRRFDILIGLGLLMIAILVVVQQVQRKSVPAIVSVDSIAVLPFEDLSENGDQQYFADGISIEIMDQLARANTLAVTGRTSSFAFRQSEKTLQQIGQLLQVATLLEGSVRKQGRQIRIVARLVDASNGRLLWTDSYETDLEDIFLLQERISQRVLEKLRASSAPAPEARRFAESTLRTNAYDLYLQARDLIRAREPTPIYRARELLNEAMALDPEFAPLYAELALAERLLSNGPGGVGREPPTIAAARAIERADQALALDANHPDALAVRGVLYLDAGDLQPAKLSLQRALEINPSHINARIWLALCFFAEQAARKAEQTLAEVVAIDPLDRTGNFNYVWSLIGVGQPENAADVVAELRRLEMAEHEVASIETLYLNATGQIAASIAAAQRALAADNGTNVRAGLALSQLRIGDIDGAARSGMPFVPVAAALLEGRFDEAVEQAALLIETAPNIIAFQRLLLVTQYAAQADERLLRNYDRAFGSAERMRKALVWPFSLELPPYFAIAGAMHRSGDERLTAFLDDWRAELNYARQQGTDTMDYWMHEARYRALGDDADGAVDALRQAGRHSGGLIGAELRYDYLQTLLAGRSDFEAITQLNEQRIAEERAELGLR